MANYGRTEKRLLGHDNRRKEGEAALMQSTQDFIVEIAG
jgi:hypothetical protein